MARCRGRPAPRGGDHFEGADIAAERVDVGYARQAAQRRTDHPVEQGPALGERHVGLSMVNMNISPSGVMIGARPLLGASGRSRGHWQALGDLGARPVDVGAVLEIEGHSASAYLGVERRIFLLGMPRRASSIGAVIRCSSSSGVRPALA